MISDLPSNCRGLVVAVAVVIAAGIASTQSAEARASTAPATSLDEATPGQSAADGAIVVADKNWDVKNDNGHKNGRGKKSGNNNHNGNWNKNSDNKNWSGNSKNWKGYGKNWSKNGGKNWSKNHHWNNNWNRDWDNRAYVRGWSRRPYYGEFFGGVVLGSILAAAGVGVVPYSPDPNLCWYWADPYMYRGYWDYCY